MIGAAWSLLFPLLLAALTVQSVARRGGFRTNGWGTCALAALISTAVVSVPVCGLSIGRWTVSLVGVPSIPLTAILFERILRNATDDTTPGDETLLTGWVFGLAGGLVLYPMALGLSSFDPYALGWQFSWLFVLVLGLTLTLMIAGNRFGVVLVASIVAYDLHLLESPNFWDYLIDPFFAAIAALALSGRAVRCLWRYQLPVSTPGD